MAQKWNAFQQAQILSNQRPEMSVGTMECNGIPEEPEENFAHEIEQLIEKENFSSMMDLQDIAESDMKDFESGSLQHTCYESPWQDVMNSGHLEQDKSGDKGEYNGNMTPCPLPNSVEVESTLEAHSDKAILETAFETNASLVEYSDISSCSDTEANLDCSLGSSIEDNISSNQAGLSVEEGDQNSSNTMEVSSAEVRHSTVNSDMSEINLQQDTGPPVTMGESKDDVNHTCSEGSLITNSEDPCREVQGMDNLNGVMPLSKDGQIEERDILSCDLDCFLDQTMMHCKELDTSQGGSTCASNHAKIQTSSTSNEDEINCPTIDSLSICQLQRTTPDAENASSKPELDETFVISGIGKDPCGDYQLERMNPDPENTSPKPEFKGTTGTSGHGKDSLGGCQLESNQPEPKTTSLKPGHGNSSQLEGQKCFMSDDEQVERSSFGFLESCFGLKSTTQNIEELKHLEHAHVNQADECNLFNHREPPVLLKTAFESNNQMDEGTDVPEDPLLLSADQTSRTFLDPGQHKCRTDNGTIARKDSFSYFKTQKRKLQPVVLLKTTEQKTCNGKNYHCFECQESAQSIDELIEHYHCTHSVHKSQYCSACECYFTGDALAEHYFCGEVKLNDELKSPPSYTKGLTEEKAKFICRYCRKSFVRQAYYEEHELKHRVVTHHRCDCCGLYFPSAHKCQSHKRKGACTPLILDPSVQTADHSESTLGKTGVPDMVETTVSNKELRDCFVKLMDVYKTNQSPEQMHCQVCGKTFRLRAQLKAHLRSHSDEKPFKCDNCGKAFKYTWNLNKHKREQCAQKIVPREKSSVPDSKIPKFKCPICFRIFKYSYNRTRHLREQCLKEYMKKGKGKIGVKYRCPLCKDVFTMASNRNRHIKQTCVKLKLYSAKGKTDVKKRKELEEVINTKNQDKESQKLTMPVQKALQYKCTFCPSVYSSKSGYYGHLAKHKLLANAKKAIKHKHGNGVDSKSSSSAGQKSASKESAKDASLSCRFCGKAFTLPDSLRKHLRLHKGNKPFRCLDCGKNFARHGHLMTHKNVHKRNVQCLVCWEVLPSIGDLLKHRQSHPKKGMLKCPDCPLQFRFPVFLLRHVAVHERRRKLKELFPPKDQARTLKVERIYKEEFKCALCQEAFPDSKALSEHCITHMPEPSATKCQFCKGHFSNHAGLIRHIRLHTGEKPFPCLTCGRHFNRKEYRNVHQEKCTGEQPPLLQTSNAEETQAEHSVDSALSKTNKLYNCSYCPHSFRFPNNLKLHERAHLAKTVFPCSKCGKFYRKRKFKAHEEICNGDKLKPACRKCGRVFTRKNYRNGHEKQCQGKLSTENKTGTKEEGKFKQQCPKCFKCFRTRSFLQKHLSLHSKETPYVCMHCGQKFDNQDRYLQHEAFCDGVTKERRLESLKGSEKIKSMFAEEKNQKGITVVHGENGESLKCKFCTKSFLRARNLRHHILTHTEVKPYRCKTCESCFSRYDHLKLHQARCRGKRRLEVRVVKMSLDSLNTSSQSRTQEGDPLQCTVCLKRLSTQSDLKRHMAMLHITDKPFPCKRCGKTYSTKKTLSRHNLTIRCKKVSKESVPSATNNVQNQPCRETSKLLQRIQVHYMNKFKYQCEYCPRRFKLSGQLKVHVRLHTGEKPYGCANCGEHFIRTDYLKRHLAKCNGKGENQEKVLCDKCGDLFTQDTLSVHQKTCVVSSKSSGSSQEVNKSPTKIKGFSCANCSDRFLLFSQLQQHFLAKHRSDQPQESINDQQQLTSSHLEIIKQEPVDEGYGQNQESSSPIRERRACSNKDISKPLKCPQCNMRFSKRAGLGMHMRIHNGVYPLSCTKCHVGFWTKKTMEKHRRKCTGNTIISNNGSALESAGELDCALNDTVLIFNKGSNTTGTGVLQTKFSCKDQDQENDAEKGDAAVHKYQCSECDQSFTDGLRLISHLEEHGRADQERKSDIHRCHVCNKVFAQAGILQRHMKIQHQAKTDNTCEICFKRFRFPSDLDIHRSCHDPSRPFVCNRCEMRFWTAKSLTIHQRMAHLHANLPSSKEPSVKARTEQPEVYRCEPCDKTYTVKKSYTKHCRLKHGPDSVKTLTDELKKSSASPSQESDKEESNRNFEDEDDSDNDSDSAPYFPCHVCGKTFLTSENLEDHQRCHLGEKPFECEECGKCFFQLANLQQHQRCHKSEFQCQMCGKGFVSLFSLRKHKQTHIRKSPHRCTKCHLSFTRPTELAEHMVTHRDENFPCDLCDETFSCKTSRAEHRKMHTEQEEELPPLIPPQQPQTKQGTSAIPSKSLSSSNVEQYKYRCGICQVRFPDPEQLSEHGCSPAKERPYSCPECNKHFLHGSHLKKHQLSHQLSGPRSYQCNHCSMSFTHHHLFLTHLRSHSIEKSSKDSNFPTSEKIIRVETVKRDKIYQCPICPESFYQALDLANHLSVHSHMCSVCNMTFPTKKDLDEHEQCHLTAATQYECTECGDSFLGSDVFRKHHCSNRKLTFLDKHHSESSVSSSKKHSSGTHFQAGDEEEEVDVGEDFIICPICKRRFSSNSSLMEHHKKHHEDPRPFKCLVCEKGFTKKRYLTQHQQIHSERPYQCDVCSESFKTEPTLISHRRMHDAKRQHQCPICCRTYLTANDLAKHKRKHVEQQSSSQDNREFRCDMCYKSFTMFDQLQKHQETHVGQVVYECTECDKAFAFLNLLEEHQRTHAAASAEALQSQSPIHFPYQSPVN
ncbi:zinc finger protein 1035 [Ctenopharyngodon idella]|uniref:zinc finger protein 1035 n=1 Tax=Ctenopharyngodon idella TaxID=7959 RepID=UPI00223216DA|nr:zinc finger protein 1035 [Ctenopharyngodon idella]XP_051720369.1 zinc finger protein 1035 [Ctenopharyngodon idella]XP_051720370.1 zinc finger protein 1035 [Ctenopharyngodon idella]XP_051720371.1 zinc finger protein 1035 [Ctenopharyngodon idella]